MKTHTMNSLKTMLLAIALFAATAVSAQVVVVLHPPAWGPVGYSTVRYYYLPDVESYYDVSTARFIYYGNGAWVRSPYLPLAYRNYDLYSGYKVVMKDYRGESPYVFHRMYKMKYQKGYHGTPQRTVGVRPAVVYGPPKIAPKGLGNGHPVSPIKGNPHGTGLPGNNGGHGSKGGANSGVKVISNGGGHGGEIKGGGNNGSKGGGNGGNKGGGNGGGKGHK